MMANSSYLNLIIQAAIVTALLNIVVIESAPPSSLVTSLPGFEGNFPSKHYAGYVTIDANQAKHMFYYFVESERNSIDDPVVLWLNGGPGCSSLFGFAYEHGPFIFEAASSPFNLKGANTKSYLPQLHLNPYSWSKVANMIYVDSPVGVGLSYSLNTSDYNTNDTKTASDLHTFLLKWFDMFPEFLHNQFFLSGESYGGVYVPMLASEIMKGLDSGLRPVINLKGYLIGNAVAEDDSDDYHDVPFAYKMGLISDELYQDFLKICRPLKNPPEECKDVMRKFYTSGLSGQTWHYMNRGRYAFNFKLTPPPPAENISTLCDEDVSAFFWLNDEGVRKSIHAADVSVSGKWVSCTRRLHYDNHEGSMIKYHKMLLSMGLQVLIYSGDQDMIVPYTGTEKWTRSLSYKVVDEWRPWISNDQIAGFTVGYDKNFTFLTVKGAGHMVPGSKPSQALDFFSRWISGRKV